MSIFGNRKKKKYRTFLQDSETGADDTREYEKGRGVWGKNNLQEEHGSEMSENLIRKHFPESRPQCRHPGPGHFKVGIPLCGNLRDGLPEALPSRWTSWRLTGRPSRFR